MLVPQLFLAMAGDANETGVAKLGVIRGYSLLPPMPSPPSVTYLVDNLFLDQALNLLWRHIEELTEDILIMLTE